MGHVRLGGPMGRQQRLRPIIRLLVRADAAVRMWRQRQADDRAARWQRMRDELAELREARRGR